MMRIEHFPDARLLLDERLRSVQEQLITGYSFHIDTNVSDAFNVLFSSKTQAFREVLLGCIIERLFSPTTDLRLPYAGHGEASFNGRTLDERIINPFLRHHKIPCSKGPFLSVFRRSVKFDASTREGIRDKTGYDAFLYLISMLEQSDHASVTNLLDYTLYQFLQLRESSHIAVANINRISLAQWKWLIERLLKIHSGGRIPVFLSQSLLLAIKETFDLNWNIECQDINVSDKSSGAIGDITVKEESRIILAIEITERRVDAERIVSTFDTKIAPQNVQDYIFLAGTSEIEKEAYEQVQRYFSLGHEITFFEIGNWIATALSLIGSSGRSIFLWNLTEMIDAVDVPKAIKVNWNQLVSDLAVSKK